MTADSELFVDETIRDEIIDNSILKELDEKAFYWRIEVPKNWKGIWNESQYPNTGKANIITEIEETEINIGVVSWITKFSVEEEYGEKYITAEASKIKVKIDKNIVKMILKLEDVEKIKEYIEKRKIVDTI